MLVTSFISLYNITHLYRSGSMVGPGALKPKVGDGIKSRRPLSAPVLHSFILLFFFLFCVCCCTSTGVYNNNNNNNIALSRTRRLAGLPFLGGLCSLTLSWSHNRRRCTDSRARRSLSLSPTKTLIVDSPK